MTIPESRIIITGASGFIGSHLARACVAQAAEVTCLLRPGSNPWRLLEALSQVRCVEVDPLDQEQITKVFQDVRPNIVFHLAANTNRTRDLNVYEGLHATHVTMTRCLVLAALSLTERPRFIHTGTIEEYGRGAVPFQEDQREMAVTPYSLTKLAATQLVAYAAREHGLPAVILRPSLTYGPLKGKGMFIPDFIRAAMTTKSFNMSPGEQTRDFMHVNDLVRAYFAAAVTLGIEGEIFNIAAGVETPLKHVAERLHELCGGDTTVNYGFYPCDPRVETMRCFMNIEKSKQRLGWEPRTALEDGLRKTVEWYLNESSAYEHLWT